MIPQNGIIGVLRATHIVVSDAIFVTIDFEGPDVLFPKRGIKITTSIHPDGATLAPNANPQTQSIRCGVYLRFNPFHGLQPYY